MDSILYNREHYVTRLRKVLLTGQVVSHELVHGELIIGDLGGRAWLLSRYELISRVPTIAHDDFAALVRKHRLPGRAVGWVDVHLLAATMDRGFQLWTADSHLAELAQEFGVEFTP